MKKISSVICISLSAVLHSLSFPNGIFKQGVWLSAWLFAIPFFFALEKESSRGRILYAVLFSFLSNIFTFKWLYGSNFFLGLAVSSLFALFLILFSLGYGYYKKFKWNFILIPCLWVSSEFLTVSLIKNFTWGIGYSQTFNPIMLQSASILGAYGISFILIAMNFLAYKILALKKNSIELVSFSIILAAVTVFGMKNIAVENRIKKHITISAVQGNIDINEPWSETVQREILDKYLNLSSSLNKESTDMIIWPESSFPADYFKDLEEKRRLDDFIRNINIPIVFGDLLEEEGKLYNSAIFLNERAGLEGLYHKINIMPIYERPPGEKISALFFKNQKKHFIDIYPGDKLGIFKLKLKDKHVDRQDILFGVTICAEDFYPELARKLAQEGAKLIINITNDSVLGKGPAAYFHAQASIMRAAENGIPFIRCANSGWTCFVSQKGVVDAFLGESPDKDAPGEVLTKDVFLGTGKTFYNKIGYVFPCACLCVLIAFLPTAFTKKKN